MKATMLKLFTALCLTLSLAAPAAASTEYANAYDVTDLLDPAFMHTYGESYLPKLSGQIGMDLRVDVVDNLESHPIEEYAKIFYDQYGYGASYDGRGAVLMLEVAVSEDNLHFLNYCVYSSDAAFQTHAQQQLSQVLYEGVFDGDLNADRQACETALELFAQVAADYHNVSAAPSDSSDTDEWMFAGYVSDYADLLSDTEAAQLEQLAGEISQQYNCPVYIVTLDDYFAYGQTPLGATNSIYTHYGMGSGTERDGLILMLSMAERDYYLMSHGTRANETFSDYSKTLMEEQFLDDFANDSWYEGFSDYLTTAQEHLELAANGTPVSRDNDPFTILTKLAAVIGLPCLVALAACTVFKSQMKSVHKQTSAAAYMLIDEADLRISEDRYTHTTQTRRTIEKKSDSRGSSGHGGKF